MGTLGVNARPKECVPWQPLEDAGCTEGMGGMEEGRDRFRKEPGMRRMQERFLKAS